MKRNYNVFQRGAKVLISQPGGPIEFFLFCLQSRQELPADSSELDQEDTAVLLVTHPVHKASQLQPLHGLAHSLRLNMQHGGQAGLGNRRSIGEDPQQSQAGVGDPMGFQPLVLVAFVHPGCRIEQPTDRP